MAVRLPTASSGMLKQLGKFLLAGGAAAGVNYGSRFLFSIWLPFVVAVTLAYLCGMLAAFIGMRRYVFAASGPDVAGQARRFTLVNMAAVVQTIALSMLMRFLLSSQGLAAQRSEAIAHLVGVLVPVASSFFFHKTFSFKERHQ